MPNIFLNRNKNKVYLCKVEIKNSSWLSPRPINATINMSSTDAEIELYGAHYVDYLVIKDELKICKLFSIGDRIYFNKQPPLVHNPLQDEKQDANFEVQSSTYINGYGEVRLRSLAGK